MRLFARILHHLDHQAGQPVCPISWPKTNKVIKTNWNTYLSIESDQGNDLKKEIH